MRNAGLRNDLNPFRKECVANYEAMLERFDTDVIAAKPDLVLWHQFGDPR